MKCQTHQIEIPFHGTIGNAAICPQCWEEYKTRRRDISNDKVRYLGIAGDLLRDDLNFYIERVEDKVFLCW